METRGQVLGFVGFVMLIGLAVFLIYKGQPALAVAAVVTPIVGIVWAFKIQTGAQEPLPPPS